jgi:hypothetical protein
MSLSPFEGLAPARRDRQAAQSRRHCRARPRETGSASVTRISPATSTPVAAAAPDLQAPAQRHPQPGVRFIDLERTSLVHRLL